MMLLSVLLASTLLGEPWMKVPENAPFKFEHCYPAASAGIVNRGDPAEFVVKVSLKDVKNLTASVDVRPWKGETVKDVLKLDLKDGENRFTVPAQQGYGHWTVTIRFTADGQDAGSVQSTYVALPPEPEKRDPYFMIDQNGLNFSAMLAAMKRVGFGSLYVRTFSFGDTVEKSEKEMEELLASYEKGKRTSQLARTDFKLVASSCPSISGTKTFVKRMRNGLPIVDGAEVVKARELIRRKAVALSDVIDLWISQEEFDCYLTWGNVISTNYCEYVGAIGLAHRNTLKALKEGDPKCEVAVIAPYCGDYYNSNPPFLWTRRLLWPMYGQFDYLALDAYAGNWNRARAKLTIPEESLAKLLRDGAALSAEYGGKHKVVIAERCSAVDYRSSFDGEQAADMLDYTVRSLLISRTVPEAICYSHHLTSTASPAFELEANPKCTPSPDLGSWRAISRGAGKWGALRYTPQATVAGMAAVVQRLAFTSNGRLAMLDDGVCVATFDAPGGVKDKSLAAVWVTGASLKASVTLPADATFADCFGNESVRTKGAAEFTVSSTPFYLTFDAAQRAAFEKAIGAFRNLGFDTSSTAAPVAVPKDALPAAAQVKMTGPKDIYPPRAVMPEQGFFPYGATFPSAEVKFAWRPDALVAAVRLKDKKHIQRRQGKEVTKDDAIVFSFLDVSPASADHSLPDHARRFVAYLDANGGHGLMGTESVGKVTAKTEGETTVYKVEIPWEKVLPGLAIRSGTRFAFTVHCTCAASETHRDKSTYYLVWEPPADTSFNTYRTTFLEHCRYLRLD